MRKVAGPGNVNDRRFGKILVEQIHYGSEPLGSILSLDHQCGKLD